MINTFIILYLIDLNKIYHIHCYLTLIKIKYLTNLLMYFFTIENLINLCLIHLTYDENE